MARRWTKSKTPLITELNVANDKLYQMRREAREEYDSQVSKVDSTEFHIRLYVEEQDNVGFAITKLTVVESAKTFFGIDVHGLLRKRREKLGKPFIKCMADWHITVVIPNNAWCRGLATPLMLMAAVYRSEPMGIDDTPVTVFVNDKEFTVVFHARYGKEEFNSFLNRCKTDKIYRTILGTY